MKNKILTIIIISLSIVVVPLTISELYKLDRGYMTPWGAEDTLAYAATIISAIATSFLAWITITQNKQTK